jgi:hypothetical protein
LYVGVRRTRITGHPVVERNDHAIAEGLDALALQDRGAGD